MELDFRGERGKRRKFSVFLDIESGALINSVIDGVDFVLGNNADSDP